MRRVVLVLVVMAVLSSHASAQSSAVQAGFWDGIKTAIQSHLGRPYVWGSDGLKSFDCSGFVWRVMYDNGILIKRTTARKLYMSLPAAPAAEQWRPGNIVFFDDLRHCGIVEGPAR